MGYSTIFKGSLKFASELTASQLAHLSKILGADVRDHPEWKIKDEFYHINLELDEDFAGISWDGSEKTYEMVNQVNAILKWVRRIKPDFSLIGEMVAQGENLMDRWKLVIKNGIAVHENIKIEGSIYRCPHCGLPVVTSEAEKIQ